MDEFESGFYDEEKLEDLRKAQKELLDAFLETGLGKFLLWCLDNLERLLTQRAPDGLPSAAKNDDPDK